FIQTIKEKHSHIKGLIWASGEVDHAGIIMNRKKEDFVNVLSSKVHGLLYFEKYLNLGALDFMALFSSVGNVFYQLKFGQVGYNAANEFLELYAGYARKKWGIHAFAINWCDWFDVGMTFRTVGQEEKTTDARFINSKVEGGIYPAEGVTFFHQCL